MLRPQSTGTLNEASPLPHWQGLFDYVEGARLREPTQNDLKRFLRIMEHAPDSCRIHLDQQRQIAPPVIYHYTSIDAACAILMNDALWATHMAHLNDTQEMQHGIKFFQSCLNQLFDGLTPHDGEETTPSVKMCHRALDFLRTQYAPPEKFDFYVTSFAENGDLSSLWQAYGDRGEGIAIGFSSAMLSSAANREGCWFEKAIYNDVTKQNIIVTLLDQALVWLIEMLRDTRLHPSKCHDWFSIRFHRSALPILPAFKHRSFVDEREWRFVIPGDVGRFDDGSRERSGEEIPHRELSIHSDELDGVRYLPIVELIRGPGTTEDDMARIAQAAYEAGYPDVAVRKSECPLRAQRRNGVRREI